MAAPESAYVCNVYGCVGRLHRLKQSNVSGCSQSWYDENDIHYRYVSVRWHTFMYTRKQKQSQVCMMQNT